MRQAETVTYLTVRQAAEQAGVSRQTLFRYIKDGKISATLNHDGQKQIDIAELLRVFGELHPATAIHKTASDNMRHPRETTTVSGVAYQIELEKLRVQLEFKDAELSLAKERISELKSREHQVVEEKNRLLTLIEQQSRLLSAPTPKAAVPRKRAAPVVKAAPKPVALKQKSRTVGGKEQPAAGPAALKPASKAPAKKRTTK